jgi:GT2 family glycosyltransferase/glycosyltransferase involved in cell wall biosynthesis
MAVLGRVDGMQGTYAVGWAVADPDTRNCVITVTTEDGNVIAKGRASLHRPDLASLQLGRTSMAFRMALPGCSEGKILHVLADGVELPGSPLEVGPGQYDGDCVIDRGAAKGWISERKPGFSEPMIQIVDQHGVVVGEGRSKCDADETDPLFSKAHFAIELDAKCFGAGELRLSILANGVKFAEKACNLRLQGNVEVITQSHCSGWLIAVDVPQRSFEIEVYRNGVRAGIAKCNMRREDVRDVFPDCKTPGFAIALPTQGLSPVEAVAMSLRFRGSNIELFEGPYLVAERPAAVVAAQNAARLANSGLQSLAPAERAVIQLALSQFLKTSRGGKGFVATRQARQEIVSESAPRLTIVIPIYRGVEITRDCIESVLAHRSASDRLLLVNDASPESGMAAMLNEYASQPDVVVLTNSANLGFIKTVNRGLSFVGFGDVLLLNSDTTMFAGGLDEMHRVAYASTDIGTVTAISNNATIFSYPSPKLTCDALVDSNWAQLAKAALAANSGVTIDVPTAHGFCMLIKGEVLRRVGLLDERFGRGYGEENDFCARAADLGYRHVAAAGVLVQHSESASFSSEKTALLTRNLAQLNELYPEYTPVIMEFERQDGLRGARWALDEARLRKASQNGLKFALVISNSLDGGTNKAIKDIEKAVGYGNARKLSLLCRVDGFLELTAEEPLLQASFASSEIDALFKLLAAASPTHVLVHQLLGFKAPFIKRLVEWAKDVNTIYYAHDFYPLCPRVTLIDAIDRFCNVAESDVCGRCVTTGGAHDASRLDELTPATHRALFSHLLRGFRHVVAPSPSTADYFRRGFPNLTVEVIAHPESAAPYLTNGAAKTRWAGESITRHSDDDNEIVLLGAIGPHKGSSKLLEIAQRAKLTHPLLRFHLIGYTNIDEQLIDVGNVTITGHYLRDRLPSLIAEARGRLALFLSGWPETYSYTLSEALSYGFIPLVPDIGAPAERVRAMKFGVVFPFPIDAAEVLHVIDDIIAKRVRAYADGANPEDFHPGIKAVELTRRILNLTAASDGQRESTRQDAGADESVMQTPQHGSEAWVSF